MDANLEKRIKETVIGILETSNMEEMTEYKVREEASEKLGVDLSLAERKRFVRQVVESFLVEQKQQTEEPQRAEEEEETEAKDEGVEEEAEEERKGRKRSSAGKEYDENGDLIVCRLADKRRVTVTKFKGKQLLSIREYYTKDGKELPGSKGISLPPSQWATLYKSIPVIEQAIDKKESM